MNLPTEIEFGTLGNIKYIYNATGQKVSKIVSENSVITTHHYQSGYQYENGNLQYFPHAEGYVNAVSGAVPTYNYVYQYKDHLGNNRLSYATTTQASQTQLTILEESHYYSFGLKHAPYNNNHYQFIPPANGNNVALLPAGQNGNYQYKYNGKEYQDELGLNMYDYGARNYDPALGRWMNIDPMAEKFPDQSPYSFVFNNPLRYIDPDGRAPSDIIVLGNTAGAKGAGHQAVLIGDNVRGWNYISKDGAAKSGGAHGESRYVNIHYASLDDFKNSAHNFEVIDGTNHSKVGGGEEASMTFKLDENGNKIQRYDQAFYINTDDNDYNGYVAAWDEAHKDYTLTQSDCSNVPTAALSNMKTSDGKSITTGEAFPGLLGEAPRVKQATIEAYNKGTDYDNKVKPTSLQLQTGEKGKIE